MTFLVVPHIVSGQVGSIAGSVTLDDTRQPAQQALVEIKGKGMAVTDSNGHYFIKSLPAGKYIVTISYSGYETSSTKWVIVTEGKETRLHVRLRNAGSDKKEDVVTEYKSPEGKRLSIGCPVIDFSK